MEGKKEENIILTKTFDFSLSIIALYKILFHKNESYYQNKFCAQEQVLVQMWKKQLALTLKKISSQK
jgi:hypothetical protein